jgi:hypothetical protein
MTPRTRRGARALLALLGLATAAAACRTSFDVEGRDTPVHVWVEAPAAASAPQVVDLTVRVGEVVAVDGPVRFPQGTTRVAVPPLYLRAGPRPVVVSAAGGRTLATATADVEHATWIVVRVQGPAVAIHVSHREPGTRD